uniref:myelin-associated glycoprotein isoform X2 n=1 Tax=Semicossyphus pulcher TaxID=241346 RepID=UPI0037E8954A
MAPLKLPLFLVCLCFKVIHTEASSWTATVPSSVKGLPGSCVVIPCTYTYPDPGRTLTEINGMWTDQTHQIIYSPVQSKIIQQYRGRTELLGDVRQNNCSLKIDSLQQSDQGPFNFRIEIANYDKFSFRDSTVSITMIGELDNVSFSVKEEVQEGETVTASCSVSHSCPASPPVFSWSHSGEKILQQQPLEAGQWKATSTLTFNPTRADHKKPLQCTVRYHGGKHQTVAKDLNVKYAPVSVKVEYKSNVKEGEAVQLKCSSDANPSASSYVWQSEKGAQLYRGKVYTLQNVSRHTEALYCIAYNTEGQGKSSPVRLNVLHAPEIKAVSSCSLEAGMVKCVCIAESRPPSMVRFVLSDRVLPNTKVEKHGPVTIGILQSELGSSDSVYCLANNTQGSANLTLNFPVTSNMQNVYIVIVIGAAVLVILLIAAGVKKWGRSGDAATSNLSTMKVDKEVEQPQYTATKRKEKHYDDVHLPDVYANEHIYGNTDTDLDDAIYANM